jgi:flagellar motility protein MotE (MotC chaperone)
MDSQTEIKTYAQAIIHTIITANRELVAKIAALEAKIDKKEEESIITMRKMQHINEMVELELKKILGEQHEIVKSIQQRWR